jgi:hypothetical protein
MTFPFAIPLLCLYNHYEARIEKYPWQIFHFLNGATCCRFLLIPKPSIWDSIQIIINTSVLSTCTYDNFSCRHFSIFVYPLWGWKREMTVKTVLHFGRHKISFLPSHTQNLNLWLLHIPETPVFNQLVCITFSVAIPILYQYNHYEAMKEQKPWYLLYFLYDTRFPLFLLVPRTSIWDSIQTMNTNVQSTCTQDISIYFFVWV